MIRTVEGRLVKKTLNTVLVECGGLGYELSVPMTVSERLPEEGETVKLVTELVVREDSHTLYGFLQADERALFCRLIKVSGIGAKTALAMMSAMSAAELLAALAAEDAARLATTPGIGMKTAERLVVDLRGSPLLLAADRLVPTSVDDDVAQALASLGYNKNEIKKTLSAMPAATEDDEVAARVRAALRLLSGTGV